MKPAIPALNPQAASYTPLEKRRTEARTTNSELSNSPSKGPSKNEQFQSQDEASSSSSSHATEESQNPSDQTDKKILDNSHEMSLAYLAFQFPNISEQCLADVYFLNEADLDATTDMLEELERAPEDSTEHKSDSTAGASSSQISDPERKVSDTGSSTVKSGYGSFSDMERR